VRSKKKGRDKKSTIACWEKDVRKKSQTVNSTPGEKNPNNLKKERNGPGKRSSGARRSVGDRRKRERGSVQTAKETWVSEKATQKEKEPRLFGAHRQTRSALPCRVSSRKNETSCAPDVPKGKGKRKGARKEKGRSTVTVRGKKINAGTSRVRAAGRSKTQNSA